MMMGKKDKKVINGFQVQDVDIDFRDDHSVELRIVDEDGELIALVIDPAALVHASLDDDGAHISVTENCELFIEPEQALWLYKESVDNSYDGLEEIPTIFTKQDLSSLFSLLQFNLEMIYDTEEWDEDEDGWKTQFMEVNRLIDRLVNIGGMKDPDVYGSRYWQARQAYYKSIRKDLEARLTYRD
jgi:hypothetical protein